VHASLIEGGEELSSYPARCVVGIERRTLPGESARDVEAELEDLLAACRTDDDSLVAGQRTLLVREPFEIPRDAEIVSLVVDAVAATLCAPPAIEGASYWADAAFIAAAGIPTVMFGPRGAGAHEREEWVGLSDTVDVIRVLVELARRVCA
jgi:acetylornithine deacetylase/succinyl-diaminopimelate desuccinylase-like protein